MNPPIATSTLPERPELAVQVKHLELGDEARWDAFVDTCSEATFFHRAGWCRLIQSVLGHRGYFLYAERNGRIEGVLPMGHIRSRLFGNALISAPFYVYGGVAAESTEAADVLTEQACELAAELGVDYLELRYRDPRGTEPPAKDLYVTFRKAIDPDPDVNLQAIPRKQRAMVRKGIKAGLVSEVDTNVDRFYALYSHSLRNLGTPVLPKKWFAAIHDAFGDDCEVLTITKDGAAVSSVMSFYFRDEVLPYYGGGADAARAFKANDFMYWELMRRACERGVRIFDYGRSKRGTGSYSFKKNWGFEPAPLHYEYHLVKSRELPDINPMNPKYQRFVQLWQRLPLSVSRAVGPLIAKNLA